MRIKVDEDLPRAAVRLLRDRGHEALGVIEQGMGGFKDPVLWQAAQAEQRFLVTADKGFADIRRYRPGTHEGVLLLRPDQDGIGLTIEFLEMVLEDYDRKSLAGTTAVGAPGGIRVRRAVKWWAAAQLYPDAAQYLPRARTAFLYGIHYYTWDGSRRHFERAPILARIGAGLGLRSAGWTKLTITQSHNLGMVPRSPVLGPECVATAAQVTYRSASSALMSTDQCIRPPKTVRPALNGLPFRMSAGLV